MTEEQYISWTGAATKVVVPLLLTVVGSISTYTLTELRTMNQQIQQLQIRVAELAVELKMHTQQPRGN
jgi:TolA-binding protein